MASIFLQFIFLLFLVSIINSIIGMFRIRKILREHSDDPNIQGVAIVNGEVKIIQKDEVQSKATEQVKVCCCDKMVDKTDVYRSVIGDEEYYFCSWECKEKFENK
ncbi:MAG: hypothetical protein BEN19_02400 [Epulopiscium sp. Nuni2H_MBin003]|nr:MAG: hypothetical protein BEN19_02400 [Epulopiscium sp. Nuni2H_MBin003]